MPQQIWFELPTLLQTLPNLKWVMYESLPSSVFQDILFTTQAITKLASVVANKKSVIVMQDFARQVSMDLHHEKIETLDPRALAVQDLLIQKWKLHTNF